MITRLTLSLAACCALFAPVFAGAQDLSATDLAARLRAPAGTAYVRLRMEIQGKSGGSLQIQTKERHGGASTEVIYQILFPKERKGEAVLLRKSAGRAGSGIRFVPPDQQSAITAAQMDAGIFESDLAYEDIVDNFFAWSSQTLVGVEEVDGVRCQILESKPGKGGSSYTSVRSWIDLKRMVPLRVEKYGASGRPLRRIDTAEVEKDDLGRFLPASLIVRRAGGNSVTRIEGSRIRHGVALGDADFTAEGLANLAAPK